MSPVIATKTQDACAFIENALHECSDTNEIVALWSGITQATIEAASIKIQNLDPEIKKTNARNLLAYVFLKLEKQKYEIQGYGMKNPKPD